MELRKDKPLEFQVEKKVGKSYNLVAWTVNLKSAQLHFLLFLRFGI